MAVKRTNTSDQKITKPVFWRLFERLGLSHVELTDDLDCLAYCERTEREVFKPTPHARNMACEYRFDPAQEFKGAQKQFYLLGIETEEGKNAKVSFIRDESDLENGLMVLQSSDHPPSIISLVPDEYVRSDPISQAINQSVKEYESGELVSGQSAIIDFLTRSKPRINGHHSGPIAASHDPEERLQQTIHAISNLDNSYLACQSTIKIYHLSTSKSFQSK